MWLPILILFIAARPASHLPHMLQEAITQNPKFTLPFKGELWEYLVLYPKSAVPCKTRVGVQNRRDDGELILGLCQ